VSLSLLALHQNYNSNDSFQWWLWRWVNSFENWGSPPTS
jgi:hypothetical protein